MANVIDEELFTKVIHKVNICLFLQDNLNAIGKFYTSEGLINCNTCRHLFVNLLTEFERLCQESEAKSCFLLANPLTSSAYCITIE